MRIPDETLAAIRASLDIVEVVGAYVPLKQRGSNYFGLCPFHQEKTPSFSVNPKLGIFKCFGCGAGGDVFAFIQQIEGVSFVEAVRLLAERAGIPLPQSEEAGEDEREPLFQALRFAARFYFTQLTHETSGKLARAYLKSRGVRPATAQRFGLGYAPKAWDALATAAVASGFRLGVFEQAGLVLPRRERGGFYDRFRHRLMFPIFSHVGKVVGFAGRLLEPDPEQPKYINSPETPVYQKGRVLYGLYQARHAIRKLEEAILVEGYTDVIALHQAGIEHTVATSGTALTLEQVRLLARYAKRILLLYDADPAGEQAALRSIDLCLAQGLPVKTLTRLYTKTAAKPSKNTLSAIVSILFRFATNWPDARACWTRQKAKPNSPGKSCNLLPASLILSCGKPIFGALPKCFASLKCVCLNFCVCFRPLAYLLPPPLAYLLHRLPLPSHHSPYCLQKNCCCA